jgi:hypothetical protein
MPTEQDVSSGGASLEQSMAYTGVWVDYPHNSGLVKHGKNQTKAEVADN